MGFLVQKNPRFWFKTKKIAANFFNRGIQTVVPRTFPTSNQETQAHPEGGTELMNPTQRFAMIEGWNSNHLWKCKLPVKRILQCRSRQALSLRTVQKVLSLRTELNSNAVTCKVCARSRCEQIMSRVSSRIREKR